jgi:hypothetical protein
MGTKNYQDEHTDTLDCYFLLRNSACIAMGLRNEGKMHSNDREIKCLIKARKN